MDQTLMSVLGIQCS